MPQTHERRAVTVAPVSVDRLPDLAALFGTNGTTRGCYCMWFINTAKEVHGGWGERNREAFESCTRAETRPMGLLAYADGEPVGWCATGPRSRYGRALRSTVLRQHDPAEDDSVWLVPCFFVRVGFRRQGIMRELLTHAVDLAGGQGAAAIEGFPLSGEKRRGSGDAYLGVESLFAACGFAIVDRPTPNRVVMRRELRTPDRTNSHTRKGARRTVGGSSSPRARGTMAQ